MLSFFTRHMKHDGHNQPGEKQSEETIVMLEQDGECWSCQAGYVPWPHPDLVLE